MRDVPEWIGEKDDQEVPTRVRVRVWDAHGGICAGECKQKIRGAWELDHKQALINGGQHRESNLQPMCCECHQEKTSEDVGIKSKTARIRAKHLGLDVRKHKRKWR